MGQLALVCFFVHGALKYNNNNNMATRDIRVHTDLQRNYCYTFIMYRILSRNSSL